MPRTAKLVLGVESSCDETAVALVRDGREVVHSLIASQVETHAKFGGVVPEIAAREHLNILKPLFDQLMREADIEPRAIDAVAVSQGPGLVGALLVGASFAKGLATFLNRPLIPVDHVHAHVHGALLGLAANEDATQSNYPLLALVVSGGHTNLYAMPDSVTFKLIAHTMDDACGESFDKVGKLLGLPYPGGPQIERLAKAGQIGRFPMPRMVEKKSQMAFSYSGLKTHMVQLARSLKSADHADVCADFQEEALRQLVQKLATGLEMFPETRAIVIAGGVAANQRFRAMCTDTLRRRLIFPPLKYCSDNAAMIAAYGWHVYNSDADTKWMTRDWEVYSRYKFEEFSIQ